ncbi:T9SS type A sorting domain-containing protein [Flavobacterium sp. LM4]|uniref:T9SS type A sorting domain-containing protein n=1 Tax=Flavobacterium sp. LM4 TaxID=1938609 RepID=UPI0009927EB3|nr:T9SS type A sorting domain-containing protein [Flavobacterium sp. LM4]OOV17131.1 secretion protein [Flavobacterium sp. LM4]
MAKNYFYITFLLAFFFTVSSSAQDSKQPPKTRDAVSIEGLSLYPNPITNGKVYISSKNDLEKEIIIFDVLGKKVLQAHLTTKELSIPDLTPGVYIIKISEQNNSATRKLIVR